MTVHDDLATLRSRAMTSYERGQYVDRVEAEIARLERVADNLVIAADVEKEKREAAEAEVARLDETLDAIEKEMGTLPLDHLGPSTERSVGKAWAMAREKRPDPELVPSPLVRALLADQDGAA